MPVPNREYQLSQSLMELQSQYNKAIADRDHWCCISSQLTLEIAELEDLVRKQKRYIYCLRVQRQSCPHVAFAWRFLLFSYYHLFIYVARTYCRSTNRSENQYDEAIRVSNLFRHLYCASFVCRLGDTRI